VIVEMAAPLGFNPAQSMLPDVKADIIGLQGGGGSKAGAFLEIVSQIKEDLQKGEEPIQITFNNKDGEEKVFTSVTKAEEEEESKEQEAELLGAISGNSNNNDK
jgi:hypothetical protein